MKKNKYFPVFIDLQDKKTVVVGGGKIAERRVRTLLSFCEKIEIVSPELSEGLSGLVQEHGELCWKQKEYEREDILDADMVLACTDNRKINDEICVVCKCLGIQVNHCGDQSKCDFYFPGIAEKGAVVVGVTASGTDHHAARVVTEKIREMLHEYTE